MSEDSGCVAMLVCFAAGLVVGLLVNPAWTKATNVLTPTVQVTTVLGRSQVEVNGVEITKAKAEELRNFYDKILVEWPTGTTKP